MATTLSGGWFSRRALVATLWAVLLVLQTLAAGSAPRFSANIAPGAALSRVCEPHGENTPAPAREDHAPCCLACALGRDGPPLLPADLAEDQAAPAPSPFVRLAYERDDGRDGFPIGWASSWSSRAPPRG